MMDEEIEDFIEEEEEERCSSETSSFEVDSDYEFDASRFFDFTRPETSSEANEAEGWFHYAPNYPPSPFVVKLNLGKILCAEQECSSNLQDGKNNNSSISNSEGTLSESHMNQDIKKARTNSMAKPAIARSSTLMKPTASLLAKQNKLQDYSSQLCQRLQNPSIKPDEKGLRPSGSEDLGTKRQKLEIGFLRKVAHLKHQALLLHKISKKVTIAKEPQLETTQRAERHRFKNSPGPSEDAKYKVQTFKARPLNRKILEGPAALPPRKSASKLTDFQVFNFRTEERAMQHASSNVLDKRYDNYIVQSCFTSLRSSRLEDVMKKEKCEFKGHPLNKKNITSREYRGVNQNIRQEESRTLADERLLHSPPIELFNKLSIKTETKTVSKTKVHPYVKGLKENAPDSLPLDFQRCVGKPKQCGGGHGIREIGRHPNMNRSLDIR